MPVERCAKKNPLASTSSSSSSSPLPPLPFHSDCSDLSGSVINDMQLVGVGLQKM
jgi:hypothetical protein